MTDARGCSSGSAARCSSARWRLRLVVSCIVLGRPAPLGAVAPASIVERRCCSRCSPLHHSVFAREAVKRWLARGRPAELIRSVYVWMASLLLIVVCLLWQTDRRRAVTTCTAPVRVALAVVQLAGIW